MKTNIGCIRCPLSLSLRARLPEFSNQLLYYKRGRNSAHTASTILHAHCGTNPIASRPGEQYRRGWERDRVIQPSPRLRPTTPVRIYQNRHKRVIKTLLSSCSHFARLLCWHSWRRGELSAGVPRLCRDLTHTHVYCLLCTKWKSSPIVCTVSVLSSARHFTSPLYG